MVLALTSVSFFMVAVDALVMVTALPAIHHSIGGSIATLEWAVNSYALTFAAGIITAAALGDRLGRRRVYVAGMVVLHDEQAQQMSRLKEMIADARHDAEAAGVTLPPHRQLPR